MSPLKRLSVESDLNELLEEDVAVLYKHSPACGLSAMAYRQVEQFATDHDGVPVYTLDVLAERELSDRVAETFGVRHESPQVFVLRKGLPRWSDSHRGVKAEAIAEQTRSTMADTAGA